MENLPVPGAYSASDGTLDAWWHGVERAETAHAYSDAYNKEFPLHVTETPGMYTTDREREAFRDGYATRAQDMVSQA